MVEDEGVTREALASLLRVENYEVAEAEDGDGALGMLRSFQPTLVLTDLMMPRLDGLSLIEGARELGHTTIFLVMTSCERQGVLAQAALRAGAVDVLRKPLDIQVLLASLRGAFERRGPRAVGA